MSQLCLQCFAAMVARIEITQKSKELRKLASVWYANVLDFEYLQDTLTSGTKTVQDKYKSIFRAGDVEEVELHSD